MDNISTELFFLMSNLTQFKNSERIITFFIEAINSFSSDFQISILSPEEEPSQKNIEISNSGNCYGLLKYTGNMLSVSTDFPALFQNAVQMLGVILEKNNQEKIISDEKELLKSLVDVKTTKIIENEERLRILYDSMLQGIVFQDKDSSILSCNKSALEILGLTQEQIIGRTSAAPEWKTINEDGTELPAEEHPSMIALKSGKVIKNSVFGVYHPIEKKHRWIKVDATPQFHAGENVPFQVYTIFTDITEQKLIEDVQVFLVKSEWMINGEDFFIALARYLAQKLVMDYVCIDILSSDELSAQTLAVYFDGKFEDNIDYTLKDTPCGDVVGKRICCFTENVRGLFPKDVVLQEMLAESYFGTTLWGSDGKPIGLIALISRKPTKKPDLVNSILNLVAIRAAGELERKKAELHIIKKEEEIKILYERLNLAANAAKLGIWDWDILNDTLEWDERMYEIYGFARNSVNINFQLWLMQLHPEDRYLITDQINDSLINSKNLVLEFKIVLSNGLIKHIRTYAIVQRDGEGNAVRVTGLNLDITEQKETEIERKLMIELLGIINNCSSKNELIHKIIVFIKSFLKCEAIGIRIKNKDDYPYYETIGFPEKFIKYENSLCSVDINGEIIRDINGNPVLDCMCGKILYGRYDSQKPYFTNNGSFWSNCTTEFLANSAMDENKIKSCDKCNREGFESVGLFPMNIGDTTFGLIQVNDKRKGIFNKSVLRILERICSNLAISLLQYQNFETIQENEETYRAILHTALDGFWRVDIFGNILEANQTICKMTGYSFEEMTSINISDLEAVESSYEIVEHLQKIIQEGGDRYETKYKCNNGQLIDVEISATYSAPSKEQIFIFIKDITERKQAEQEILESEKRFRLLVHSAPEGIFVQVDKRFAYVNNTAVKIFGAESYKDLLYTPVLDRFHSDYHEKVKERLTLLNEEKTEVPSIEEVCLKMDGTTFYAEVSAVPMFFNGRNGALVFFRDITERKFNEERVKNSLREKEVLIRELYHRTKNNMQVICAILNLKSASITDISIIAILKEMEYRIRSMALVHQKLYQSQNLSRIDLKDYIAELSVLLISGFNIDKDQVSVKLNLEKVEVLIDTAIPCGLVLNEIISNSLKYAFPHNRKGEIFISLRRTEDGEIELKISDNGVGIKEDFDFEHTGSLGLQIVNSIINDQLQGSVETTTKSGVSYFIRFKDTLYSERV